MSAKERRLRSRLTQLAHKAPMLRGTLSVRHIRCGKKGCHCAEGPKHRALYLVLREGGKLHQLFIPKHLEADVRTWVKTHAEIRKLLDELSAVYWDKIRQREK